MEKCSNCGKAFSPPAGITIRTRREILHFCSVDCLQEYMGGGGWAETFGDV